MKTTTLWKAASLLALAVAGCGSSDGETLSPVPTTSATGGAGGGAGAGGTGGNPSALEISLPQAVDGALLVDPEAYETVPLHVTTSPFATAVEISLDTQSVAASAEGEGQWTAELLVGSLADGVLPLRASASAPGAASVEVEAELVVAAGGVQRTRYDEVGDVRSPRLHRAHGGLWLTSSDRAEPEAELWLERLDGAGRAMAPKVRLVDTTDDVLYGRTVFGEGSIGVLYQQPGTPYRTFFTIVDSAGIALLEPVALDPEGTSGAFGGEVSFDGEAFVLAWRVRDGTAGRVLWARVEEASHALTGPIEVAASGPGTVAEPEGGFGDFSYVDVESIGSRSMVAFVRERYDATLEILVPKSQLALVDPAGTVLWTEYAGVETDWTFHRECRLGRIDDAVVAVWSAQDLEQPGDPPPNWFYATQTDAEGNLDPERGQGVVMVEAPNDRDEPFLLTHPMSHGVVVWSDDRAYEPDPLAGYIALYVAPFDEALTSGTPVEFPSSRLYAGISDPHGVPAGSNLLLAWRDIRNSPGLDKHFELWLDTAWY